MFDDLVNYVMVSRVGSVILLALLIVALASLFYVLSLLYAA